MKIIFPIKSLLFILLFFNISCSDDKSANDGVSGSFDMEKLSELRATFENELALYYRYPRAITPADVRHYLDEVSTVSITIDFFSSDAKLNHASKLMSDPIFKSIWDLNTNVKKNLHAHKTKLGLPSEEIIPPTHRPDYYLLNPYSPVYEYLIKETKNEKFRELLKETQILTEVNLTYVANKLLEIDDFEDEAIRTFMSLQFYHEYVLKLNRLNVLPK